MRVGSSRRSTTCWRGSRSHGSLWIQPNQYLWQHTPEDGGVLRISAFMARHAFMNLPMVKRPLQRRQKRLHLLQHRASKSGQSMIIQPSVPLHRMHSIWLNPWTKAKAEQCKAHPSFLSIRPYTQTKNEPADIVGFHKLDAGGQDLFPNCYNGRMCFGRSKMDGSCSAGIARRANRSIRSGMACCIVGSLSRGGRPLALFFCPAIMRHRYQRKT
ncbi:hypothetical protein CD178_02968 [Komagataeibacter saccharivorans]|uniref:Uncharacterized protein n=1 Tax=Komagataeibacter saccharivorans TaxID=265959 RepID=A0A347WFR9_9PROT|nr:hypothetical protein CD178_02968 [Komagataeibacter saccharivorans]